jgi:hypothetical protein
MLNLTPAMLPDDVRQAGFNLIATSIAMDAARRVAIDRTALTSDRLDAAHREQRHRQAYREETWALDAICDASGWSWVDVLNTLDPDCRHN